MVHPSEEASRRYRPKGSTGGAVKSDLNANLIELEAAW